jgi:hypothetical protein
MKKVNLIDLIGSLAEAAVESDYNAVKEDISAFVAQTVESYGKEVVTTSLQFLSDSPYQDAIFDNELIELFLGYLVKYGELKIEYGYSAKHGQFSIFFHEGDSDVTLPYKLTDWRREVINHTTDLYCNKYSCYTRSCHFFYFDLESEWKSFVKNYRVVTNSVYHGNITNINYSLL